MLFHSVAILSLALLTGSGEMGDLPRQAALGIVPGAPLQVPEGTGVLIEDIAAPELARQLGFQKGDVLLRMDGRPISTRDAVFDALGAKHGGEPARIDVVRGGKVKRLSGRYPERPRETYQHGTAAYGTVSFRDGQLRDILVTPPGGAAGPVLFLIQGYTCTTMEASSPESPYRLLIEGLLRRNISVYRVEKPQVGDSRGGPACMDIDFNTELDAFRAGYRNLVEKHGVDPNRLFMLGHSMGGIQAPLLAAEGPSPRGVAMFGTVVRNWADYLMDVYKYQGFHGFAADPAENERNGEKLRTLFHRIYVNGEAPAALAAEGPENETLLRQFQEWDGKEIIGGRNFRYWHQLTNIRLIEAWRNTHANVLSIFGESDIAAMSRADHELIARVVNHYRPGTARFVEVPRTSHAMTDDGTLEEVRKHLAGGGRMYGGKFNPQMVTLLADWIESSLKAPPVANSISSGRAGG